MSSLHLTYLFLLSDNEIFFFSLSPTIKFSRIETVFSGFRGLRASNAKLGRYVAGYVSESETKRM